MGCSLLRSKTSARPIPQLRLICCRPAYQAPATKSGSWAESGTGIWSHGSGTVVVFDDRLALSPVEIFVRLLIRAEHLLRLHALFVMAPEIVVAFFPLSYEPWRPPDTVIAGRLACVWPIESSHFARRRWALGGGEVDLGMDLLARGRDRAVLGTRWEGLGLDGAFCRISMALR